MSEQTIADFAQSQFPDKNRSMFSNKEKPTIIVPTLGGGMPTAINLDKSYEAQQMAEATKIWEANDQIIKDYNANITTLDPDYSSVEPVRNIIVRCWHIETVKNEFGIYIAPEIPVKEITQNGIGVRKVYDSPWKLMRKAVVVAVPRDFQLYNVGDIVDLIPGCVMAEKPSVDHPFILPFSYLHPDYIDFNPPSTPGKHFGYLILDPYKMVNGALKRVGHGV